MLGASDGGADLSAQGGTATAWATAQWLWMEHDHHNLDRELVDHHDDNPT